jgi:hypothetical protein
MHVSLNMRVCVCVCVCVCEREREREREIGQVVVSSGNFLIKTSVGKIESM